jgi:multidrug efflux system membrane fusion protein
MNTHLIALISILRRRCPSCFSWRGVVLVCALLGGLAWVLLGSFGASEDAKNGMGRNDKDGRDGRRERPVSVAIGQVTKGDLEVVLNALGTVTALNTVTIKPRVDGLLERILFKEGQAVKAGDVLAELDPRPFRIAVDQAHGQLQRDQAQLANTRIDLERYRGLLEKDAVSRQQLDTQAALVQQYEGVVKLDQAQVDNAQLQLDFSRIKAPVAGRLGLRQVDLGNMVKSADATGLVVLTQTQPISVIFALSAETFPAVLQRWLSGQKSGETLKVDAWSRDNKTRLATGKLQTVDNQIDTTTGTVRLKAVFDNSDNSLFPNQFVNIRLRAETLNQVILAPEAAIQRGTQGDFVYVLKAAEAKTGAEEPTADGKPPAKMVSMRSVKLGPGKDGLLVIEEGLQVGEQVVVDGLDKLRDGAKVMVPPPAEKKGKKPEKGEGKPKGNT